MTKKERAMNFKEKIAKAKAYHIQHLLGINVSGAVMQKTNCVFHDDSKPSLVLYPTNTFYCFAGCGGGDVITFYQKLIGCDFVTAVEELSNGYVRTKINS